MKRIVAVLLAMIIMAFSVTPIKAHTSLLPASSRIGEVYSNDSTGEAVVRIQTRLRELGYLNYKPTGAYRSMTAEAVRAFQIRCNETGRDVVIDGKMNQECLEILFSNNAPRAKIPDAVHMPRGPLVEELVASGELMDWSEVKGKLRVGSEYTIIDCNTGEEFKCVFTSGENHAEMELASEDELESFNYICGDEYNFLKRPVVVEIDGRKIAASIQCYPHGSDTLEDNGMEGHVCVFFNESLSHVGSLPDVEHNANVYSATGH